MNRENLENRNEPPIHGFAPAVRIPPPVNGTLVGREVAQRTMVFPPNLVPTRNLIIGDGNCGFRALAYYLYGDQEMHSLLRQRAVETIRNNVFFRNQILPEISQDEYLRHMSQDDARAEHVDRWMTDLEIQAIAYTYRRQIMVISESSNTAVEVFTPVELENISPIFIYHLPGHYEIFCNEANLLPAYAQPAIPMIEDQIIIDKIEVHQSKRRVSRTPMPIERTIENNPAPPNSVCWICDRKASPNLKLSYCGFGVHGNHSTDCHRILCSYHYSSLCKIHNKNSQVPQCKTCSILF